MRIPGSTPLVAALASALVLTAAQKPKGIYVCVAADRLVRFEPSGQCAAGQVGYRLAEAQDLLAVPPAEGKPNETIQMTELKARLDAAQKRMSSLESYIADVSERSSRPGSRFVAPFTVVDDAGKEIFSVQSNPRGWRVSFPSGDRAVVSTALPGGGFVKALSQDQNRQAVIGVSDNVALVTVRQGDKPRGTLSLLADGTTWLTINNAGGKSVAALNETPKGAGHLLLANPSGEPRVEGGTLTSGVGLVRVGPQFKCAGSMGLAPPDCIKGHP